MKTILLELFEKNKNIGWLGTFTLVMSINTYYKISI